MKTTIILTLLTLSAFAQRNPQIRTCNITEGIFNVYDIPSDNIGHCIYGNASVDTISLMEKVYHNRETTAVAEFLDGITLCRGEVISASNNREETTMCAYADGSTIRLSSLRAGSSANENKRLVEVLNSQI